MNCWRPDLLVSKVSAELAELDVQPEGEFLSLRLIGRNRADLEAARDRLLDALGDNVEFGEVQVARTGWRVYARLATSATHSPTRSGSRSTTSLPNSTSST